MPTYNQHEFDDIGISINIFILTRFLLLCYSIQVKATVLRSGFDFYTTFDHYKDGKKLPSFTKWAQIFYVKYRGVIAHTYTVIHPNNTFTVLYNNTEQRANTMANTSICPRKLVFTLFQYHRVLARCLERVRWLPAHFLLYRRKMGDTIICLYKWTFSSAISCRLHYRTFSNCF